VKIIFWGTPRYAAENLRQLVSAGYEVIAVVTQPDRKRSRGKNLTPTPVKQAAIDFGLTVYETQSISKDQTIKNKLLNLNADVYIVVAFGQILPKELLDQPPLGCWNSHASLLPKWRGAAPIQWSMIDDDLKTGICIMAMEEGLDTGPVIEIESTDICDTDNLDILTNRLCKISSNLLVKSLENIKNTKGLDKFARLKKLNAIDQSKLIGTPSYARQINKDDYIINWNQTARKVRKKIQGLYPNAYTYHNSKRIKILEVNSFDNSNRIKSNQYFKNISLSDKVPGEILIIQQQYGIVVMTNDYPILIKSGQLEGKNKTDSYTLSLQSNLKIKNKFGI
tara:strand:+ start:563 stop:1573 length:1011 start_codon:yes stop_codon:yes gene_type:complete